MKKSTLTALIMSALLVCTNEVAAQKQIIINSEPSGADIYINEMPTSLKTPTIIKKPTGNSFNVTFKKEGYEDKLVIVNKMKSFDGKKAFPVEVNGRLTPKADEHDPTITTVEAQNMVSRNKPGQSELERTVLRWYFDSDPRGARIFWRVISSVPAVVKNTNELYLMTTPFEETRSFNILGLTYENSRDVQIEIKVVKSGYEPQVKRFNVRQAIDQQEISSFFELVKKEE